MFKWIKENWINALATLFLVAAIYIFAAGLISLGVDSFGKFLRFVIRGVR